MEQELKVLLYRCYMLAFEAGYSSGSVYSAEDSWEHNKYFFEDDIKAWNTRTENVCICADQCGYDYCGDCGGKVE